MTTIFADHKDFRFSQILRKVWPKNTAKHAARASGSTIRAAETWLADLSFPRGDTLRRMALADDALRAEIIIAFGGAKNAEPSPITAGRPVSQGRDDQPEPDAAPDCAPWP